MRGESSVSREHGSESVCYFPGQQTGWWRGEKNYEPPLSPPGNSIPAPLGQDNWGMEHLKPFSLPGTRLTLPDSLTSDIKQTDRLPGSATLGKLLTILPLSPQTPRDVVKPPETPWNRCRTKWLSFGKTTLRMWISPRTCWKRCPWGFSSLMWVQ